jgi:hypothetical protein
VATLLRTRNAQPEEGLRTELEPGLEAGGVLVGETIEITLDVQAVREQAAQAA